MADTFYMENALFCLRPDGFELSHAKQIGSGCHFLFPYLHGFLMTDILDGRYIGHFLESDSV